MTHERLGALLDDLASTVPSPDLARTAWEAGRRRRQTVAGALAATLVAGLAGVALAGGGSGRPPGPVDSPTPSPSQTGSVPAVQDTVQLAPARNAEAGLPWAASRLPRRIVVDAAAAVLSADPVDRAVALVQELDDQRFDAPVFVLGVDGRLRRLGVDLKPTRSDNPGRPLIDTSLSPDGERAAFAQPDSVVVVDLTTGKPRRYDVPGDNESVRWHPDLRRVLVFRERGSVLLDTATGRVHPVIYGGRDSAFTVDGNEAVELKDDPGRLMRWRVEGDVTLYFSDIDRRIYSWVGSSWVTDDRIARGAATTSVAAHGLDVVNPEAVAVVELRTGKLVRMLVFGGDRTNACCPVHGWLGPDTVLFASRGDGVVRLLAWNITTGAVSRVAEMPRELGLSVAQP